MSELEETPPQEQVVVSPELSEKIAQARDAIVREGQNPEVVMGRNISEMGFFQAAWKTLEPHARKLGEIQFKQLKAQAALVLSLIPVIGQGKAFLSTAGVAEGFKAGRAAFQAEKGLSKYKAIGAAFTRAAAENAPAVGSRLAGVLERSPVVQANKAGALRAERIAQNIAAGQYESVGAYGKALGDAMRFNARETKIAVNQALDLAAEQAGKRGLGKAIYKGLERAKVPALKKIAHPAGRVGIVEFFDLTPDMPLWLTLTTGAAEMVGVHGADAIPATLQIGKNVVDMVAVYGRLGKDMWNLTVDRIAGRKNDAALTRATNAFSPSSA